MKSVFKAALSLFVGTTFISCAGTDSSVQKKAEENPNLFRADTPIANILVSKLPEFARSIFKGPIDSIPGEYYYYVTDGKIDSLLKKEGEQFTTVATIAYDSPNRQNSYELKRGNEIYQVRNDLLVAELNFPKHFKKYWSNGTIQEIATGTLYRDSLGGLALDSGISEAYFEDGKINQQNVWKNKQPVASKEWNENGVLIKELDFPHLFVEYWDNGIKKQYIGGIIYRDDDGVFKPDSGRTEIYSKGEIMLEQGEWKNKSPITNKVWNENGVLIRDLDFQKSCTEYWDDGKLKQKLEGILYMESVDKRNLCRVDSGRSEIYAESGKLLEQNDWKGKHIVTGKLWNEDGTLIREIDFPKYIKEYYDNGNPKGVMAGILYSDDKGDFALDSGRKEFYSENGKMLNQSYWENKQIVASKQWNEGGVLTSELDFPKHHKDYYDNGKIKCERIGLSRTSSTNFEVENGSIKEYYENGKTMALTNYTGKDHFSSKRWSESGILIKEIDYPKAFKEYWNNGKLQKILVGTLYRDNQGVIHVDSGHSEIYFENEKIKESSDWKDKQPIASKQWNENGVLTIDLEYPNYVKEYWSNGKLKNLLIGVIYKDDQGDFATDSGRSEIYFENGKIKELNDWKNKQPIASKQWNENGTLVAELDFPKYFKTYWSNGKLKNVLSGTLYRDNSKKFSLDSGRVENYSESGEILVQIDWKNKLPVAYRQWNEKGDLNHIKLFYNDGTVKSESTGIIVEENGLYKLKDGVYNEYNHYGRVTYSATYKNFQIISEKM